MNEKELIYISRQFANMFGINVRVYHDSEKIFYQSSVNLDADPVDLCINEILINKLDIGYYVYDNYFYYSFIKHGHYKTVIGPVSELKYSAAEAKKIGVALGIKPEKMLCFASEIRAFCGMHLDTLIQISILFNFTVNHTMYNISDIRIKKQEQSGISTEVKESDISFVMNSDFYSNSLKIIAIEEDIVGKIRKGDVNGLIEGASKIPAVSSGQLASQLLRHHKNFFIRLETIVSRAAYQAGLNADEILLTEEKYIMKCESLDSIDRIKNLQYHMILDYADRVLKFNQFNTQKSRLVSEVIRYIMAHISESIKTSDIAAYLGKNRTNLSAEFKRHIGINLSDFIKQKKIQEAKELLIRTDKALPDIAYLLGFSSQSHFCKVFKEIIGQTPTEYRNKNHI